MTIAANSRLILRTWEKGDTAAAFEFYRDPEVSKFIGDGKPLEDIERVEALSKKFNSHQQEFGYSPWAVIDVASGGLIGICGLHTYNEASEPELGFRILRSRWGEGLATEASKLSLEYAFNKLGIMCVSALTHPSNFATQNVLMKSGFILIGNSTIEGRSLLRYEVRNNMNKSLSF